MVNDPACTGIVQDAIRKVYGEEALFHVEKTMIAEDFSQYLQKVPGCFVFVGGRNEAENKVYPHHHACFDIDEEALARGTGLLAAAVLEAEGKL